MPPSSDRRNADAPSNRMLEDPAYSSVVRWSSDGDSFVVLEVCCPSTLPINPLPSLSAVVPDPHFPLQNEKFTKTILPKHFKHSNFASFVRQLNKYDFHKVRHNEENGDTLYGKDVGASGQQSGTYC